MSVYNLKQIPEIFGDLIEFDNILICINTDKNLFHILFKVDNTDQYEYVKDIEIKNIKNVRKQAKEIAKQLNNGELEL